MRIAIHFLLIVLINMAISGKVRNFSASVFLSGFLSYLLIMFMGTVLKFKLDQWSEVCFWLLGMFLSIIIWRNSSASDSVILIVTLLISLIACVILRAIFML